MQFTHLLVDIYQMPFRAFTQEFLELMERKTLTLKTLSLHGNNSECGAKEVKVFVSA